MFFALTEHLKNLVRSILAMQYIDLTRSVARGGGLEPPHWLVKYAKSHAFCAFEADFM